METMTQDNLKLLRSFAYHMIELRSIAKKLHKLDEGDCNGRSEQGQKRADTISEKLFKRAEEIAGWYGLQAYHQGDPRGCTLYLVNDECKDNYTDGIAIY